MERIVLESPMSMMEGANTVYLLQRGDTTALVDAGAPSAAIRDELRDSLARYDRTPEDVDAVLLTHGHPDHAGLAGWLQERGGASVYLHDADRFYLDEAEQADASPGREEQFEAWGLPTEIGEEIIEAMEGVQTDDESAFGPPSETEHLDDGQTITVGDLDLEVGHTPGHTQGSVIYAFDGPAGREAFTGDTLLPNYTSNIGGDTRIDNPVERYIRSLHESVSDLDRAWPGHREPIDSPAERIHDVVDHHRERAETILGIVRERETATAWEVATAVFDDLEGFHAMLGAAEIDAHLLYLERAGVIDATENAYRARPPGSKTVDEVFAQHMA